MYLQIQSRRSGLVSLSQRIFCTHHPSEFPLARPTSFSFVLGLSFCLKTAKKGRKRCNWVRFPKCFHKQNGALYQLVTITRHYGNSGNHTMHSGIGYYGAFTFTAGPEVAKSACSLAFSCSSHLQACPDCARKCWKLAHGMPKRCNLNFKCCYINFLIFLYKR